MQHTAALAQLLHLPDRHTLSAFFTPSHQASPKIFERKVRDEGGIEAPHTLVAKDPCKRGDRDFVWGETLLKEASILSAPSSWVMPSQSPPQYLERRAHSALNF